MGCGALMTEGLMALVVDGHRLDYILLDILSTYT